MHDHTRHAHFTDLLTEAAAGELSDAQRSELERHAEHCDSCRAELASFEALGKLLASRAPVQISDEMLNDARMELRTRIRVERSGVRDRAFGALLQGWLGAPAPRLAFASALMLTIGIGLGYLLFTSSPEQSSVKAQNAMMVPGDGHGGSQITAVRFIDADASDGEVEIAFQAVRPMRLKGSPEDPAIQRLLAYALVTEPNPGIRIRTVNTLTENAHPQIDPEIRRALVEVLKFDTNPGVRKQAMHALRTLPMDEDIKGAILYVLANDPNEGLRIDAINALLPDNVEQVPDDDDILEVLKSRMQNENNNYIRLRTKAALQEVQP